MSNSLYFTPTTSTASLNGNNIIEFQDAAMGIPNTVAPAGNSNYSIILVWQEEVSDKGIEFAQSYNYHHMGFYLGVGGESISAYNYCDGHNNTNLWLSAVFNSGSVIDKPMTSSTFYNGAERKIRYMGELTETPIEATSACNLQEVGNLGCALGESYFYYSYDLHGFIAETIIYHRQLSVVEIEQVELYVQQKWGL